MNPSMHSRLIALARSYPSSFLLTVSSGFLAGVMSIGQVWFFSSIIDAVYIKNLRLDAVFSWLLLLLALLIARSVSVWIQEVSASNLAVRIKSDLQSKLSAHIRALGPAFTRNERTGELVTAATEGIEALDAYFREYLPQIFITILVPLSILVCVLPIDLLSGLIMLFTAPLIPYFMVLIGKAAETLTHRQFAQLSRMAVHFLDSLQGLATLKMFNRSKAQARLISRVNEQYCETTLGVLRYTFLSSLALELLCTLSTAIIAVQIGLRLLYSGVEFHTAFFVLLLAPEFYLPLRMLGSRFHSGTAGTAAARKIYEILDTPAPTSQAPSLTHTHSSSSFSNDYGIPGVNKYSIRFENVSFTYPDQETFALQDINLSIPFGTRLALVGRTGAGKSTLGSLLLGFNFPSRGRILSGSGTSFSPEDLRRIISWVPQKPHLFRDTIAANLRLARVEASDAELVQAARAAQLHDFILTLPDRYQTMIGEGGARLSAGQAQRLAMARALLKNAPILLLDEPTSNLDPETEFLLEQSAVQWMHARTVLTIAHRLNTIAAASQIVVLDLGKIVETGTHAELLEQKGIYFSLIGACKPDAALDAHYEQKIAASKLSTTQVGTDSTFQEPKTPAPSIRGSTFIKLAAFLRGSWKAVFLSTFLAALTTGASVALLGTSAWLISTAALHPSIGALSLAIVGVRFFGISRGVFRYFERLVSHRVTLNILTRLRNWFYERLEPLAPARLMQMRSGDLLARIVSDINSLENFYVRVLLPTFSSLLVLTFTAVYLSQFHPIFALVQIAGFLTIGVVMPILIHRLTGDLGVPLVKRRGDLHAFIVDGIQGMADLLVMDTIDQYNLRAKRVTSEYGEIQRQFACRSALGSAGLVFLSGLTVWALLWIAIHLVNIGHLNGMMIGVLVLVCLASFEALQPFIHIPQHWDTTRAAAVRLFEIVDTNPAIDESSKDFPLNQEHLPGSGFQAACPPALEVSHLTFYYPGNPVAALNDLSFCVDHGHSLAIVGPTGSGKTTLINLLLRFWEYQQGDIYLEGISLKDLSQESIRARLRVLNQNPWFFNASIAENLRVAHADASIHDLEKAASRVYMNEMIKSLPDGFQTIIGEQGVRLSGGERQRLALARVLLKKSKIAILDEPSANLDPLTEAQILQNLMDDLRNTAMIVITHRLVGMERFGEILVMNQGRIIERGTHRQLSANGRLYTHLLNLQNRMIIAPGDRPAAPGNATRGR